MKNSLLLLQINSLCLSFYYNEFWISFGDISFKVKVNSDPFPCSDFIVMLPPNYSTIFFEILSPNPIPPVFTPSPFGTYPKSLNNFF